MMNVPFAPPTDSVYKFIAIAGIALMVVSVAVPLRQAQEYNRERGAVLGEIATLGKEFESFVDNAARIRTTASHWQATTAPTGSDDSGARGDDDGGARRTASTWWVGTERDMRQAALHGKTEQLKALRAQVEESWRIFLVLFVFGAFTAAFGFRQWYRKLQRPQDQLLALQLAKAQREEEANGRSDKPPTTD